MRRRFVVLLALALAARPAVPAEHPQDGPHADVRLAVEQDGFRADIKMNLAFADEIAPAFREDPTLIHELEEPALRDALLDYFKTKNPVTIDGVEVTPRLRTFEVIRPGVELLPLFPISGMRGLIRVGVVLEYPTKSEPQRVSMVWGTFPPDRIAEIDQGAEPGTIPLAIEAQWTAEGRLTMVRFTRDEPEFTWHASGERPEDRFLAVPEPASSRAVTLPIVSIALGVLGLGLLGGGMARTSRRVRKGLGLAGLLALAVAGVTLGVRTPVSGGSGPLAESEAIAIFEPLHANIYRAFDYTDEGDIYDALARSVDGRLLDALYNEVYQSLIMYEEGGAVSRVQEVVPVSTRVESIGRIEGVPGFRAVHRWRVTGSVYHWGHSHWRTNEYEAEYLVLRTATGWRIAQSRTLEQMRIEPDIPPPDGPIL